MNCIICTNRYDRIGYLLWCNECSYGTSALPTQTTQGLNYGLEILKYETSKEFSSTYMATWMDTIVKTIPEELFKQKWLVVGAGTGVVVNTLRAVGVKHAFGYEPRKAIFGQAQQLFRSQDLMVDVPETGDKYDVIIFWSCFTDVPYIERVLSLYDPKYIMLDVNIYMDKPADIFGWAFYLPGEIQYYFTPIGMDNYLKWLGYEVCNVRAGEPAILVAKPL
jgi:hypothetical protein